MMQQALKLLQILPFSISHPCTGPSLTIDENVRKRQICEQPFRERTNGPSRQQPVQADDGLRALKIARDGGIEPAMIEIVAKDGTIFRVYGENAALTETTQDTAGAKAWDAAIAKLKAKAPPKGR
jgi:hypothetical protein